MLCWEPLCSRNPGLLFCWWGVAGHQAPASLRADAGRPLPHSCKFCQRRKVACVHPEEREQLEDGKNCGGDPAEFICHEHSPRTHPGEECGGSRMVRGLKGQSGPSSQRKDLKTNFTCASYYLHEAPEYSLCIAPWRFNFSFFLYFHLFVCLESVIWNDSESLNPEVADWIGSSTKSKEQADYCSECVPAETHESQKSICAEWQRMTTEQKRPYEQLADMQNQCRTQTAAKPLGDSANDDALQKQSDMSGLSLGNFKRVGVSDLIL